MSLLVCLGVTVSATNAGASGIAFDACRHVQPSQTAGIRRAIGRDWHFYKPFMKTCPVFDPDGRIALRITALSLPEAEAAGKLFALNGRTWKPQTDNSSYDPLPDPIVSDLRGHIVGHLPVDVFPTEPVSNRIEFDDWRDGWPQHIVMHQTDPTISPRLSSCGGKELVWDRAKGHYAENRNFCSRGGRQ